MSANLLQYPGKMHMLTDDLESFLHVLGWMTLRYVPAIDSYSALRRGKDMAMFDEHEERKMIASKVGISSPMFWRQANIRRRLFDRDTRPHSSSSCRN